MAQWLVEWRADTYTGILNGKPDGLCIAQLQARSGMRIGLVQSAPPFEFGLRLGPTCTSLLSFEFNNEIHVKLRSGTSRCRGRSSQSSAVRE